MKIRRTPDLAKISLLAFPVLGLFALLFSGQPQALEERVCVLTLRQQDVAQTVDAVAWANGHQATIIDENGVEQQNPMTKMEFFQGFLTNFLEGIELHYQKYEVTKDIKPRKLQGGE